MKKITDMQFEIEVRNLINKKKTRKTLAKELGISMRTLNNMITKLSKSNPELYAEFVSKFPYKPKEIVVNSNQLAIKVIINGLQETSNQMGISVRTISRKIKQLEKTNPKLYELYQIRNNPMTEEQRVRFNKEINEMINDKEVIKDALKEKEELLRITLSKFEEKVRSGLSKNRAAKEIGFDGYPTICKKYKELERIQAEKEIQNNNKQQIKKNASLRERLYFPHTNNDKSEKKSNNIDNNKNDKNFTIES